jgi:hypothetical protein
MRLVAPSRSTLFVFLTSMAKSWGTDESLVNVNVTVPTGVGVVPVTSPRKSG